MTFPAKKAFSTLLICCAQNLARKEEGLFEVTDEIGYQVMPKADKQKTPPIGGFFV